MTMLRAIWNRVFPSAAWRAYGLSLAAYLTLWGAFTASPAFQAAALGAPVIGPALKLFMIAFLAWTSLLIALRLVRIMLEMVAS